VTTPPNLDALRAIPDAAVRAAAAGRYIEARQDAIREALAIRDEAILTMLPAFGVTQTARFAEVSISTVKLVRAKAKES
jgi:hypothetical protein